MKKIALSLLVLAASGAYVWSQSGPHDAAVSLSPPDALRTGSIGHTAPGEGGDAPLTGTQLLPAVMREANGASEPARATSAAFVSRPPAEPPPVSMIPPPAPVPPPPPAPIAAVVPESPSPPTSPKAVQLEARLPRPRPDFWAAPAARNMRVTPVAMKVAKRSGYADGTFTGSEADAYYGIIQIQAVVQNGRLVGIHVLQYPSDRQTSVRINRQALPWLRDEVISAQSANVDIISGATLTSEAFIRSIGSALRQAAQ